MGILPEDINPKNLPHGAYLRKLLKFYGNHSMEEMLHLYRTYIGALQKNRTLRRGMGMWHLTEVQRSGENLPKPKLRKAVRTFSVFPTFTENQYLSTLFSSSRLIAAPVIETNLPSREILAWRDWNTFDTHFRHLYGGRSNSVEVFPSFVTFMEQVTKFNHGNSGAVGRYLREGGSYTEFLNNALAQIFAIGERMKFVNLLTRGDNGFFALLVLYQRGCMPIPGEPVDVGTLVGTLSIVDQALAFKGGVPPEELLASANDQLLNQNPTGLTDITIFTQLALFFSKEERM